MSEKAVLFAPYQADYATWHFKVECRMMGGTGDGAKCLRWYKRQRDIALEFR